jgi:hypothetical protein
MKLGIGLLLCLVATFVYALALGESTSPVGLWQTIDDETGEVKSLVRISEQGGKLIGIVEKLYPNLAKTRIRCARSVMVTTKTSRFSACGSSGVSPNMVTNGPEGSFWIPRKEPSTSAL